MRNFVVSLVVNFVVFQQWLDPRECESRSAEGRRVLVGFQLLVVGKIMENAWREG
jgi:hypothetical protein